MKRRVSALLMIVSAAATAAAAETRLASVTLPLRFERNDGQADARVRFVARGRDAVYLADDALIVAPSGVRVAFAGANPHVRVVGAGGPIGRTNYFAGRDSRAWRAVVPNYDSVRYENLYPDVDLIVYGRGRDLEYDFVIAPHARPETIRLTVEGGRAAIGDDGGVRISTVSNVVSLSRPRVYQDKAGVRHEVGGRYRVLDNGDIGFTIDGYDRSSPLVIDPILSYSTYLGGADWDVANDLRADAAGNAYVCGYTASLNFPAGTGRTYSGGYDAFIAKIRSDGALEYATYLGGTGFDSCNALAVDPSGAVYAAGGTTSSDFPVVNALQSARGAGSGGDAFITKIDPTGSVLLYSTYLGGSGDEDITGIALDAGGAMYVTGVTNSPDFPLVSPVQAQYGGGFLDVFAAKIDAGGGAIAFSTLMGGSDSDEALALAVTPAGEMYVGGVTMSTDFPIVAPIQAQHAGGLFDGFLFKLSAGGSAVRFSTYLGTSGRDALVGLKAANDGSVLVSGYAGFGFPTTAGAFQPNFAGYTYDGFVSRLSGDGQRFLFSTYFGGNRDDVAKRIETDGAGNIWIVGSTDSTNLPVMNPVQGGFGGGIGVQDAFVAELSPTGSQLRFSTYLGGSDIDSGLGLGIDAAGNAYVAGQTASIDFPTVRAIGVSAAGPRDAFVARIVVNRAPTADAGPDQHVAADASCRAAVTLDGSASSDPDGDALSYAWRGGFGNAAGVKPVVTLGTGSQAIELTVADASGATASDVVQVTVSNSVPPTIAQLTAAPSVLAPPNHQLVSVSLAAAVTPACATTATCRIISVASSEPINGTGDGDTAPDWIVTGPLTLQLRAERSGSGARRIYTILVECIDSDSNRSQRSVTVTVP